MAVTAAAKGLEFDPGFGPHILAFRGTVEILYSDINRFKNFSQKKTKFMQYHKKILDVFYNNVGFYTGCLMWAAYIKAQPEQEILSNSCLNGVYSEEETISDTQYLLKFAELFPKDMKYFLGKEFEFEPNVINLIQVYEEFLILNKGFTQTKLNSDVVLPEKIRVKNISEYKTIIDKAIESKDLSMLKDSIETLF